jgi:hypothetical protein
VKQPLGLNPGEHLQAYTQLVFFGTTFEQVPEQSNPPLPSLASIRDKNELPSRKSTVLTVVCQSTEAAFHLLMWSGLFHADRTESIYERTRVSTAIFIAIDFIESVVLGRALTGRFRRDAASHV